MNQTMTRTTDASVITPGPFLLGLILLAVFYSIGLSLLMAHGVRTPGKIQLLWQFEFSLILTWWVRADRRLRGLSVPFEFDAAVFFGWPVVVPIYLYRSRGKRGLLAAAGVFGLFLVPYFVAAVVSVAVSGVH